ncbi:MAG: HAD-IC family P-type ATPase, partial [Clostridiales bacterium]|nr:HAD-IC family P-type ATPase [Clostridiales bacterium]
MKFYDNDRDEVLNSLNTSPSGLSSTEARKRLEEGGLNKLKEAKKTPLIIRFLEQLKDPMIIILLVAAIVSGVVSVMTNESFADTIIIIVVVLLNATLGVLQESKAEKAIEALQAMSRAQSRVMRDGVIRVVKSEDLVIGDIVLLEAGDAVPADGRIIECASLQIEEAALTGESVPVTKQAEALPTADKDVPLGDRVNMCYMGSTVAYGRGYAVITATGMDTEMGKIADALTKAEAGKTPLQKKLGQLSKILTYAVVGICIFMFAFSLLTAGKGNIDTAFVLDTFMIAVSLAVAAIPEGLATVVTISLSIGVTKMSKRNAVIRKLTAVETLGCTEIICSDKTGTLTLNRMTVVRTASIGDGMVDALNMSGDLTPSGKLLCTAMSLCSDAEPDENDTAVGEPTECALVNFATLVGLDKRKLKEQYPRIGEAPFDSVRKLMTTVHSFDGDVIQFTKGAPDELLKRCTMYFDGEKAVPMTDAIRERILADNKAMADDALRALAAAMRTWDDRPASMTPSFLEQNLTFIGIVGMIDPVRPEAIEAVRQCRSAGIRPIMITGDHRDTAAAIAKQIGIITDSSEVLTGAELSEMSDEELDACI